MMGEGDTDRLRRDIHGRIARVAELTEAFFAPGEVASAPTISREDQKIVDGWRSYPALRSARATTIFKRVQPRILTLLDRAANRSEALRQFDGFLGGLPAGVQLFSLFEANPQLVELIVDICATAPGLANYLSHNADVLDAVIGGDFFAPWPGAGKLTGALAGRLSAIDDYEGKLTFTRSWMKEWHFRIGVHLLRGLTDAATAGREYADLAEACVAALWPPCVGEFSRKHGAPPGRGAVVLGMGSLGAGLLNAGSDLDLIVIYDAAGKEASDGPRPLAARPYYARLTQSLVTALTAPMPSGRLYEVDMRLRPSGRQGPVATSLQAFQDYQMNEAWTWEHLALTRARPLAGNAELAAEVEELRKTVLAAKCAAAAILSDTAEMRGRIFAAKTADGALEAKIGPGRLLDIELMAQTCALRAADPSHRVAPQLRAGVRAGFLTKADAAALQQAYRFFWRLQVGARLLGDRAVDMASIGEGARAFLLRETGASDMEDLKSQAEAHSARAGAIIVAGLAGGDVAGPEHGKSENGEETHGIVTGRP